MDQNLKLYIEFAAKSGPLVDALRKNREGVKSWATTTKREVDSITRSYKNLQHILGGVGLGFGMYSVVSASAKLDKSLIRVRQTAGATKTETNLLRKELFSLGATTGQSVGELVGGVNALVASGQSMTETRSTITAIAQAMAISGANAETLSNALTVAGTAFNFDLSKPEMATLLLDKMVVAGRLGNAELEDLSGIFGRIAVNASSAGMSFDKTLTFVELLSKVEKSPEKLATLADSTLRIFNNAKYAKKIEKQTGIKFFENGDRRDAFEVLADIRKTYQKIKDEEGQASFIEKVFGVADQDTIKGMRTLLNGDLLTAANKFNEAITNASGRMKDDFKDATNNMIDQAGRLKAIMAKVGDDLSRPINRILANTISGATNSKEDGGMGLNGYQLLGGAALLGGGIYGISKLLKRRGGAVGGVAGGVGDFLEGEGAIGTNIAKGKVYEQFGVQSVFVVNMPNGLTGSDKLPPGFGGVGANGPLGGAGPKLPWLKYGGTGVAGKGALATVGAFAAPIAIAAGATFAGDAIVDAIIRGATDGKYKNWMEAIFFRGGDVARANQGIEKIDQNSPEFLALREKTREKINNNITVEVAIDGKQLKVEQTKTKERRGSFR